MHYRLYLYRNDHIRAGQAFSAFSDQEAYEIGSVLYDACSDVMDGCEVWRGSDQVATIRSTSEQPIVTIQDLTAVRQHHIVTLEESLSSSFTCIRESRRLLDLLSRL